MAGLERQANRVGGMTLGDRDQGHGGGIAPGAARRFGNARLDGRQIGHDIGYGFGHN